jgi:hypothetical protein
MRLRENTRMVADIVQAGRHLEQASQGGTVRDEAAVAAAERFGELAAAAPPLVWETAADALEREFPGRYRLGGQVSTRPPGLWTARLIMAALGLSLVITGAAMWYGAHVPWWACLVPVAVVWWAARSRRLADRAAWAQRERAARQARRGGR